MVPLKFQLAVSTYRISKGSSAEDTQAIDLNAHHAFYPLETEVLEDSQIHSSIYEESTQRFEHGLPENTCICLRTCSVTL